MSFLLVGDLHLGLHPVFGLHPSGLPNRLHDAQVLLYWLLQQCGDDIKRIVFLGDIFDDRTKIPSVCLHVFGGFLLLCKQRGITVVVLRGNHDILDSNVSSLHGLQTGLLLIESCELCNIAGISVAFIPYTDRTEAIVKSIAEVKSWSPDVILGHFGLGDVELQAGFCEKDKAYSTEFDGFRGHVILGHYHNFCRVSKDVFYLGTPMGKTFAEANSPRMVAKVHRTEAGSVWVDLIPVAGVRQLKQVTLVSQESIRELDPEKFYYKVLYHKGVRLPTCPAIVRAECTDKVSVAPVVEALQSKSHRQMAGEWITGLDFPHKQALWKLSLELMGLAGEVK